MDQLTVYERESICSLSLLLSPSSAVSPRATEHFRVFQLMVWVLGPTAVLFWFSFTGLISDHHDATSPSFGDSDGHKTQHPLI